MSIETQIRMGSILLYILTKTVCMAIKMYKENYGWGEPWCFVITAITDFLMIAVMYLTW